MKKQRTEAQRRAWKQIKKISKNPKHGIACKRIQYLRQHATSAEKKFIKKLRRTGIKFQFQKSFFSPTHLDYLHAGCFAIVDFFIPYKKICIEIDGGYHNTPAQKSKDAWRDNWLTVNKNVKIIRLSNDYAEYLTPKDDLIKQQQKRDGLHPATNCATGVSVGQKEKAVANSTNTADYVQTDSDGQSGCDNARNGVCSA